MRCDVWNEWFGESVASIISTSTSTLTSTDDDQRSTLHASRFTLLFSQCYQTCSRQRNTTRAVVNSNGFPLSLNSLTCCAIFVVLRFLFVLTKLLMLRENKAPRIHTFVFGRVQAMSDKRSIRACLNCDSRSEYRNMITSTYIYCSMLIIFTMAKTVDNKQMLIFFC